MSRKYAIAGLVCFMVAGVIFCGCDSKSEEGGKKPEPAGDVGAGGMNVEIQFC